MQAARALRRKNRSGKPAQKSSHVATVRGLRTRKPSERHSKVVAKAHDFMASQVDPLLAPAITYLLVARPSEVLDGLATFFDRVSGGEKPAQVAAGALQDVATERRAERADRAFMVDVVMPTCHNLIKALV